MRLALYLGLGVFIISCTGSVEDARELYTAGELERIYRASPLPAPPADTSNAVADNPIAARLGQYLFFDKRFSGNGRVSCATCHDPATGFTHHEHLGKGIGTTPRNTPTVINTAFNRWFFWDGRADTQWAQALQPMEDPSEQGGSRLQFAHLIYGDPRLRTAFEMLFGPMPDLSDTHRFPAAGRPVANNLDHPHNRAWESMTTPDQYAINRIYADIGKSLAAYERLLISRDAPFDRFVEGLRERDPIKQAALSKSARWGLKIFVGRGQCHLCHLGPNFTNSEFHSIGIEQRDWLPRVDLGRAAGVPAVLNDVFNAAGPYSDDPNGKVAQKLRYLRHSAEQLGQFKVPSLRNVALTAPYMHGGQFESLEQVVRFYSRLNETPPLNHREMLMHRLDLSDREVAAIVAFLQSLTGAPIPPELTTPPAAP